MNESTICGMTRETRGLVMDSLENWRKEVEADKVFLIGGL